MALSFLMSASVLPASSIISVTLPEKRPSLEEMLMPAHDEFVFLGNDVGDVAYNTDIVVSDNAERDGILGCSLAAPFRLHDAVTETAAQFLGVRTIHAMYLDTLADGNESEDWVAVDRVAAISQFEIDALEVLIDNQHMGRSASSVPR